MNNQHYQEKVTNLLHQIKVNTIEGEHPYTINLGEFGELVAVTMNDSENQRSIALLAQWREKSQSWFPSQFKVTLEGTKKWTVEQLMNKNDRLLFWVMGKDENNRPIPIGHVGLYRFLYDEKACELDNIIRGVDNKISGIMTAACRRLMAWCFTELEMETLYLRVVSDNDRAIRMYEKLGYREIQRVPLRFEQKDGESFWKEVTDSPYLEIKRYFVTMKVTKTEFYQHGR